MAERDYGMWTQLATRIPKSLHHQLKVHCVTSETSVMDFVVQAVEEKLARDRGRRRRVSEQ
jgi:predicted HicB family RNase H-like nuclease